MAAESGRLDYWRTYFQSANYDIFEVIEHAILVAASDCPKEFRLHRDRIAENLFTCQLGRCFSCDRVKQLKEDEEEDEEERGRSSGGEGDYVEKDSKVNSCSSEPEGGVTRVTSNYSYDEAEALTEEMEEESQIVEEVLRIKEILGNNDNESDEELFQSLRRLQLMVVSVEVLKATEIGRAVNGLRRHRSKEIRHLVRTLIDGWKVLVDEWVSATAALTESTPESMNPSVADNEEGLPSPPMDEGALFTTQTTMELSQFFDGMDDDGNLRNNGEFGKGQESGRKPYMENHKNTVRKQQDSYQSTITGDNTQVRLQEVLKTQTKLQEAVNKQTKPQELFIKQTKPQQDVNKRSRQLEALNRQNKPCGSDVDAGPGRPQKALENKALSDVRFLQHQEPTRIQKKPLTGLHDKPKCSDEVSVRIKLEATKRKLHEGYQQAENAKRQRTIQVMELQDLPKQGLNHRQPFIKQGNHSRHWVNGRR